MNKLTKRLLSMAVAVVLVMAMLPTVFAEDPVYTDWDGSSSAIVDGAYLKLTDNVEITERYTFNAVTVTIDLNGKKITSTEAIQFMYITTDAEVTLKNGTVEMPGLATDSSSVMGGLIQVQSGSKGLTLDNVTITKTGNTTGLPHAAIMYARKPVLIKNSTLQVTAAEQGSNEGGLIKLSTGCTLTIDNSTLVGSTAKYGGAIFATGSGAIVINSGSVTGGTATTSGGDIYTASNATIEINGGEVGDIYARGKSLDINGGVISNVYMHAGSMTADNCTVENWDRKSSSVSVQVGPNVVVYSNPNAVATGCEAYVMDKSGEKTKYTTYADFDAAIAAAQSGNTVSLLADVTTGNVMVPAGVTLNLYGKTLTANSVSSAFEGAQIKDEKSSKNAGGKLVCSDVTVNEDNVFAPIYHEGVYHFQKFAITAAQNDNVYKFYFADAVDTILLDDVWANSSEDSGLELVIDVTWTNGAGVPKSKTFVFGSELVAQYAAGWDSKMFTLTFSDLTNVTDLVCTARVAVAA